MSTEPFTFEDSTAGAAGKEIPAAGPRSARSMTTERFITRAKSAHPDAAFDYSRVVYASSRIKVTIVCPEHGPFEQLPYAHLQGHGCRKCGQSRSARMRSQSTENFIARATEVHDGKGYDYSQARYARNSDNVTIGCPWHGSFVQKPSHHLAGSGCPACGREATKGKLLKDVETFIHEARAIHGDKYDYSRVVLTGAFQYSEIVCPRHGSFWQTPDAHINSAAGCNSCTSRHSGPHKEIERFLTEHGIEFRSNDRRRLAPVELDIYVEGSELAIEFNGSYWHSLDGSEPAHTRLRHLEKFAAADAAGITLLQIDEHEWSNAATRAIWQSIILSKLGKHKKLHARATEFHAISSREASQFLAQHHLQGATPGTRWCFGLRHEGRLAGVLTFAAHQKVALNLTRLAFARGLTIVGGAQKLFRNALRVLPVQDIVTFSNNRYSNGSIYTILGFAKDGSLPPSYQWLWRNRLWNKRLLRRARLATLLGEEFHPRETEHQNLFRAGARCLYDAGYVRWVYRRTTPD